MRKTLALTATAILALTGCGGPPREHSAVDVTPPPVVEVPKQTLFHQALKTVLAEDAIISTGVPAVEALNTASAELAKYAPTPETCAATIDPEAYTTTDVAMGFESKTGETTHVAQTVVIAGFETADDAATYFQERTRAWAECQSVDLTIDETNVLTLHYTASSITDTELEVPELFHEADQEFLVTSSGELSGALQRADTDVPNPGALPDYVISPDDVPEPETENIQISNATVVLRFDTQVYWMTVEPENQLQPGLEILAEIVEAVHAEL